MVNGGTDASVRGGVVYSGLATHPLTSVLNSQGINPLLPEAETTAAPKKRRGFRRRCVR